MIIGEIFAVALGALRANKLRSMLTMLGIVIGVGAVIAVIALGTGAQSAVKARIQNLGTTLLTVTPGQGWGRGIRGQDGDKITMKDLAALKERETLIKDMQPEKSGRMQVQFYNKNTNTSIAGTTPNHLQVRNYKLVAGRFFDEA